MFNPFENMPAFIQQFQLFQQQMQGKGNPQQLVQNMLNTGQMSQDQFNQLRMMANQITGKTINHGREELTTCGLLFIFVSWLRNCNPINTFIQSTKTEGLNK